MTSESRVYLAKTLKWALVIFGFGVSFLFLAVILMTDGLWTPVTITVPGERSAVERTFHVLIGGAYWLEFHAPVVDQSDDKSLECAIKIEIQGDKASYQKDFHRLEYAGTIPAKYQQIYMATTDAPNDNVRMPLSYGQYLIRLTTVDCNALNQRRGATLSLTLSGDPTGYVILKQGSLVISAILLTPGSLLIATVILLRLARRRIEGSSSHQE